MNQRQRRLAHRRDSAKYRRAHPERVREASRRSSKLHRTEIAARQKEYYRQIRLQVLRHYSSGSLRCACCGLGGDERYLQFLTLDHINGGGRAHRRSSRAGVEFYRRMRQLHYPGGLRVLCWNCNLAMRPRKGTCEVHLRFVLDATKDGVLRARQRGRIIGRHPVNCGCGRMSSKTGKKHRGSVKPIFRSDGQFWGWRTEDGKAHSVGNLRTRLEVSG